MAILFVSQSAYLCVILSMSLTVESVFGFVKSSQIHYFSKLGDNSLIVVAEMTI